MTYLRLVTLLMLATYVLILVGGATRVFDAGMSCPDWPHCYGAYIPFPENKIAGGYVVDGRHYAAYQVALEWGHRALASLVGVGMLFAIVFGLKRPKHEELPLSLATTLLLIQIGLGGLTILKANAAWSVAIHLGTAMLFFSCLVWLRRAVASGGRRAEHATPRLMRQSLWGFTLLVWLTMIVGAMVSTSFSGGVCGGLFSCAGQWMPHDFQQHLHMQHRFLAVGVLIASVLLLVIAKRKAPAFRPIALHAHLMVLGQVALGILTLYSFEYYPAYYHILSVFHLGWGTLVLLAGLGGILHTVYGQAGRFHRA